MTAFDAFAQTVSALAPRTAVVLGSGLAGATTAFVERASVGFGDIPGLVPPTVHGHGGKLAVGEWAGVPALLFLGRLHFYEGHPWQVVTGTVRTVAELGAKRIVLHERRRRDSPVAQPGDLMATATDLLLEPNAWHAGERGTSSLALTSPEGRSARLCEPGGGKAKRCREMPPPHPPRL